eukprot:scaffold26401_cov113-Cylindrotheca_fusiformis.AAC.2
MAPKPETATAATSMHDQHPPLLVIGGDRALGTSSQGSPPARVFSLSTTPSTEKHDSSSQGPQSVLGQTQRKRTYEEPAPFTLQCLNIPICCWCFWENGKRGYPVCQVVPTVEGIMESNH